MSLAVVVVLLPFLGDTDSLAGFISVYVLVLLPAGVCSSTGSWSWLPISRYQSYSSWGSPPGPWAWRQLISAVV